LCITASTLLASANAFALATNHPPFVSWIPDQAITGTQFAQVYFRAWDKETPLGTGSLSYAVKNDPGSPNFYNGVVHIAACSPLDAGCLHDGTGFKLTFDPLTNGDGAATIEITATDGGIPGVTTTSSFTLRKQGGLNPPVVGGIPNEQIQKGISYGPVWFVVDDLDSNNMDDTLDPITEMPTVLPSGISDNHNVVADSDISFTWLGGLKWSVTVTPTSTLNAGRAEITVTFADQEGLGLKTSTSFVLDVIPASNTPPSFTPPPGFVKYPSWIEQNVTQNTSITYNLMVTDGQTLKNQLLVTATSSNANLVPNSTSNLIISPISSTGTGTLTIKPKLPLPSPSPGVPQAATITLAVTDNAYTRRMQFLYVAKNPAFSELSFSRPTGVYNVDVDTRSDRRPNDPFLTGETHQVSWQCIDNGDPNPMNWNWCVLDNVFSDLPLGEVLSINLIEEPSYITAPGNATDTWCDTSHASPGCGSCPAATPYPACTPTDGSGQPGILRALPWDTFLQQKRNAFLEALAAHPLPNGTPVANEQRITIVNPNLSGGDTGIRELNGVRFSAQLYQDYSRAALFSAVESELLTIQQYFPGKLVHIGFFTVDDDQDLLFGESLWHWLYTQLTAEFNGPMRVHFFQEDLAAARASAAPDYIPYIYPPSPTAYSFTPNFCQLPSFAFNCGPNSGDCQSHIGICPPTDSEYDNGITYQANTAWSSPFIAKLGNDKVIKTLSGTPNDAMEAAFNSYLNEYLEVYRDDLDHAQAPTPPPGVTPSPTPWDAARWSQGLQSWKEYFDHVRITAPTRRAGRPEDGAEKRKH
jgi:hypothetical protein